MTCVYGLPDPNYNGLTFMDVVDALDASPKPTVLILEQRFPPELAGKVGLAGGNMVSAMKALGCVGLISNGPSRDLDEVRLMNFQYMLTGVTAGHGAMAVRAVNVPVSVGGMDVAPGEIIHMDENGAVKFPADKLEAVLTNVRDFAEGRGSSHGRAAEGDIRRRRSGRLRRQILCSGTQIAAQYGTDGRPLTDRGFSGSGGRSWIDFGLIRGNPPHAPQFAVYLRLSVCDSYRTIQSEEISMRLGLNWVPVRNQQELTAALPLIDELGLGAIAAPAQMAEWTLDQCAAYGEMVRSHGLVIGEVGYWRNLLVDDEDLRARRIDKVRALLVRADAMQTGCVVTLVGSFGDQFVSPHADNWSDRARERAAENCLRILDGLALTHTSYALEPWCNGFFHEPQAVADFLNAVDHPRLKLHLDVMNMHSVQTYFQSTEVIDSGLRSAGGSGCQRPRQGSALGSDLYVHASG